MSFLNAAQPKFFSDTEIDWTFNGENTRQLTHCFHDYPARMIPQVARQFLRLFARDRTGILLDPYCGTGTTLVEGFVRGFDCVGFDLNPLARLIAKAKTTVFDLARIDFYVRDFDKFILSPPKALAPPEIAGVSRLEFWFKPEVIEKLSLIKNFIEQIAEPDSRLFFLTAFSETVREASNTRTHEFKLYRYDAAALEKFQPDVFGLMTAKLQRNRQGAAEFLALVEELPAAAPRADILELNTVEAAPAAYANSVEVVLTSPPYGDSTTTVAYGQYSRLSAAWLGLSEPEKTDGRLMGSKKDKAVARFDSAELDAALREIAAIDEKRAVEVSSFYRDLQSSVENVSRLVRPDGLVCYVVGNRKVKGIVLPTDLAVKDFFERNGFKYLKTFHRAIPNKRMPLRNSPSNVTGKTENTMNREYIVVLQKK